MNVIGEESAAEVRRTSMSNEYLGRFKDLEAAIRFENEALSIGIEYLPLVALAVIDGEDGTSEYWAWLCQQVDELRAAEASADADARAWSSAAPVKAPAARS